MNFNDMKETIKGDYAEELVQREFEKKGYDVYTTHQDKAHPLDGMIAKDGVITFFDVKSKCVRNISPDTGCDMKHYKKYKSLSMKHNATFLLIFVDEGLGKIYFQILNEYYDYKGGANWIQKENGYPLVEYSNTGETYIYYPLSTMKLIRDLTEEEIMKLKQLSNQTHKSYDWEPKWDFKNLTFKNENKKTNN